MLCKQPEAEGKDNFLRLPNVTEGDFPRHAEPKFDLVFDAGVCPQERSALMQFYISAKGQEWTDNDLWMDDYER